MKDLVTHERWPLYAVAGFAILYACFTYDAYREPTAIRQLRKAGIPSSVAALKDLYPSEPRENNGAFLYLQAAKEMKEPNLFQEDNLPIAGNMTYNYAQHLNKEQREALHGYVSANATAIALIQDGQRFPVSSFPEDRFDSITVDYLDKLRKLMLILYCAALDAALSNDTRIMEMMITSLLVFPDSLSKGALFSDMTLADSLRFLALHALEDCLYFTSPSQDTIRTWINLLTHEQYTTLHVQKDALRNQLSLSNSIFYFEGPYFEETSAYSRYLLPGIKFASEWSQFNYFAQNLYVQSLNFFIAIMDKPFYEQAAMSGLDYTGSTTPRYITCALFLPPLQYIYPYFFVGITKATAARTALGALLYKVDHGRLPENLEMLTPDYLPVPPRDPFTLDAILRYRLTDKQALFYSVGPNERDDGGKESEESILEDGDIVFRLPIKTTINVSL